MAARPIGSVLVIGGGISGVQAALNLVECGYSAHIVENGPALGGVMARLDKIFPTNDCSLCLLSPQMVECERNENIEIHTNSTVLGLEGESGRFRATIWTQPTYIDMDKCIACHKCVEACPRSAPDEFNESLNQRKAAYILYRQAVPLQYVIDADRCLRFSRTIGGACELACPTGAINFKDEGSVKQIEVGSVLLATGVKPYDPSGRDIYGYGVIPDVVTSLEFERLISASGPGGGTLKRRSDLRGPRRIAWLQCVGSRDENNICSNICCMYAIKQAMAAPEHLSPGPFEATIFCIDIRTPGKGHEQLFNAAMAQGVRFIHARPDIVRAGPDNKGVVLDWIGENGGVHQRIFDMLVLSVGMTPSQDSVSLCNMLGVNLNRFNFVDSSSFSPHRTSRPGVFVTGGLLGPKDIPQSVAEASAASAAATADLSDAKWTRINACAPPAEREVAGPPRIGVFLCACGTATSSVIDLEKLANYAGSLPRVVHVEVNAFTCPQSSQEQIIRVIRENDLNRVVVAACTPKTHEQLYRQTLRRAGLNPSLLEMVNLRNHVAWVHREHPDSALEKARGLVRGAVGKAALLTAAHPLSKRVTCRALVVGGGMAGMTAALTLAEQGVETVLVEKRDCLGGLSKKLGATWIGEDISERLRELIRQLNTNPMTTVLTGARVISSRGSAGSFVVRLQWPDRHGEIREKDLHFGAVVLCVGGRERPTDEYLHGRDDRVMTQLEFDRLVRDEPELFKTPRRVAFIQCVGSREPDKPYCSRVCCTHTIDTALHLKQMHPDTEVMVFHRDVRTFGLRETHYQEALRYGTIFVRYTPERKPEVGAGEGVLEVRAWEGIIGRNLVFKADYVVLAVAIEPGAETKSLADMFRCGVDNDGFLMESNRFIKPVDLGVNGIFAAGLCHSPMPVDEAVSQAKAAAFRACRILSRKRVVMDTLKAEVTPECDGCGICVAECGYGAISGRKMVVNGEDRVKISIDPVLCQGCGACETVCPVDGIMIPGFSARQIRTQAMILAENRTGAADLFEPRIIAFCCNWCSYIAADMAGMLKLQYPPNVRIVRVMCAGMVDQGMVLDLLNAGADGVAILGCRPGECNYVDGNTKAGDWAVGTWERMKNAGFDPRRFMVDGVASSEERRFVEILRSFTGTIRALGAVERPVE